VLTLGCGSHYTILHDLDTDQATLLVAYRPTSLSALEGSEWVVTEYLLPDRQSPPSVCEDVLTAVSESEAKRYINGVVTNSDFPCIENKAYFSTITRLGKARWAAHCKAVAGVLDAVHFSMVGEYARPSGNHSAVASGNDVDVRNTEKAIRKISKTIDKHITDKILNDNADRLVTCCDNIGYEDQFDVGIEYVLEDEHGDGIIEVFNKRGEPVKIMGSRFKLVKGGWGYDVCKFQRGSSGTGGIHRWTHLLRPSSNGLWGGCQL